LFGVDCRPDAIKQARSGSFAVSDLKDLSPLRRQRYFHVEGREAFIAPRLREKAVWHVADFAAFQQKDLWDVILFRNVAIYLQTEYADRIWHRLGQKLSPGGVLVTGTADRPPELLGWKRESACIYRKPQTLNS
jgi:chemotaxis methyl-accepting protein methylase